MIKKYYIELDEFDRNIRNIFNYGHSFGHAIESATHFKIPHGVAVSIGMDMANYISAKMDRLSVKNYNRMRGAIKRNFANFKKEKINLTSFIEALSKDKKNLGDNLVLILPSQKAKLEKVSVKNDDSFKNLCKNYFDDVFPQNIESELQ